MENRWKLFFGHVFFRESRRMLLYLHLHGLVDYSPLNKRTRHRVSRNKFDRNVMMNLNGEAGEYTVKMFIQAVRQAARNKKSEYSNSQ